MYVTMRGGAEGETSVDQLREHLAATYADAPFVDVVDAGVRALANEIRLLDQGPRRMIHRRPRYSAVARIEICLETESDSREDNFSTEYCRE